MGAGTGYYTTLLAKLVGETGTVDAYEIEPEFARRAANNLAEFPMSQCMRDPGLRDRFRIAMFFM